MKTRLLFTIFLVISSLAINVNARSLTNIKQLNLENRPASINLKATSIGNAKILAQELDLSKIASEDVQRKLDNLPYRFAVPVTGFSNLKEQGRWEIVGDLSVWRLTVSSKQAQSFNIGMKNLFLPQQAKLYFYTKEYQSIVGPYTHKDNKTHKELWSPILESGEVTIEINIPTKMKPLLSFDIDSISQGYRGIRTSALMKSGSCNNDVVCSEADAWRNEIRSVARYTITDGGSTFYCTGTLMNNTNNDLKPYFLTAGHCGINASTSPSIVIYWNYETSICGGTPDGQLNQFQSGTTFLATSGDTGVIDSDFAIVELDSSPDPSYNVYWSGWDRRDVAPSSAVAIHHPSGDEKRISFDNNALTITNYTQDIIDPTATHLRVGAWEDGTTEGGSSGSGIWNEQHYLVGTLSGGAASCLEPSGSDWYGRLASHWEGNGTTSGQAKAWLDPSASGVETLEGRNACDAPTLSNVIVPATGNIGEAVSVSAEASGGTGPYTFSWDFNGDSNFDLSGATASYTYNYLYQGNIRVTVTDSNGCPSSEGAAIVIGNTGDELFPKNEEIPSDWIMGSNANASWQLDNVEVFEGVNSLKSETIVDSQTASIEVTQNFEDLSPFISFVLKVSSEQDYDYLNFSIDGEQKGSWSGEIDWTTVYYPLTNGEHTLKWDYVKDQTVSEGADSAWIDGVTGITFPTPNDPPIAIVAEEIITISESTEVTLDASASSDPEGNPLSFSWSQTSGQAVTLSANDADIVTFTSPSVTNATVLTFEVVVTDNVGATDRQTVTVNVNDVNSNQVPLAAVVQSAITINEGLEVTLDASNSSDPDNDTLTFAWQQTAGSPTVSLSNANTSVATFLAPEISSQTLLTFTVTVTDPSGATNSAEVTVTINNVVTTTPPPPPSDSGGGGAITILYGLFLLTFIFRRKLNKKR